MGRALGHKLALVLALVLALLSSNCASKVPTTTSTSRAASTTATTTTAKASTATSTASSTTSPGGAPTTSLRSTTTVAPAQTTTAYGEIKVAVSSFYTEKLYPVTSAPSNNALLVSPILEGLIGLDGSALTPMLAESWNISTDGASWVYRIRKGIKFQNGDNLTSADVKFSLDRFASKDSYQGELRSSVKQVEVVDDYTVRIFTLGPQPYLPYVTGYFAPHLGMVMPKNYIEKNSADYFAQHPVGSGPWKFVRHSAGDMVQYEAVDKHWRQVPEFKTLSIMLIPTESTRTAMLKTGQADVVEAGTEEVIQAEAKGFKSAAITAATPMILLFGAYDARGVGTPIANVKVRQALSMAINRDEINKTFFSGKAQAVTPPQVWEGSSDIDYKAMLSYGADKFRFDATQAKDLLKQAGYPDGFKFTLYTYPMGDAAYLPKLAEIVQGYWRKIGVTADITATDWGTMGPWGRAGPNGSPADRLIGQASTHSGSNKLILPQGLRTFFRAGFGTRQITWPGISELDRLVDSANIEMDPKKRQDLVQQAVRIGTESYTYLPFGNVPYMALINPRIDIPYKMPSDSIVIGIDGAKHKK